MLEERESTAAHDQLEYEGPKLVLRLGMGLPCQVEIAWLHSVCVRSL